MPRPRLASSKLTRGGLLAAALATIAMPASGQVSWQALPTGPTGPPERNVGPMDFVHSLGKTFVYAGWHPSLALTDLWSFDGSTWTLEDPAAAPGYRFSHSMSYDLLRDRLMVFGGARGFYLNDTWELDCQTLIWTQATPANSPTPRAAMSFAFDLPRGVHVLFGGEDFSGRFNETWEWDGTNWTPRVFATNPAARSSHAMAYDARRGRIVMFGGMASATNILADTWEYDGSAWTQQSPATSPSPRGVHAMAWDALREVAVMHGGNSAPWQPTGLGFDETWEWNGVDWTQRTTAAVPANSWQRSMTYDPIRQQVLLFGGGNNRDELWSYGPIHPAATQGFGAGCPGSLGLPTLLSVGPLPWLGETLGIAATPVPATGAILVIGLATTSATSLQSFGLPGCSSFVTYDAAVFAAAPAGSANWNLAIPNQAGLLGFQLHQQAAVLDPLATGGAAVSNALTFTVGGR